MVKHVWSVLCEESIINQDNNIISLQNVMEGLELKPSENISDFKRAAIPVKYEITTLLSRLNADKKESVKLRISHLSPKLDKIRTAEINIDIPPGKRNMRSRFKSFGIPIVQPGIHVFLVELKQQEDAEYKPVEEIPFEVKVKVPQAENPNEKSF